MSSSQKSLGQKKEDENRWKLIDIPKDDSFLSLEVGKELIGRFVCAKTNFFGRVYYIIEKDNGEIVKLNDTTNLHKWMENVKPGDMIKIVHEEDRISPQPDRNPLQLYKVYRMK